MSDKRRELRSGHPIWLSPRAAVERRYPTLAGRHRVEVAIVGGGITGALVAQAFAEAGVSVALIERDLVATGSTAASSALLLQEPDLGLDELRRKYGIETGRHLWRLSQDAARDLIARLRRLEIHCDLVTRDAIYYAIGAKAVETLHREFELRKQSGLDGRWLEAGQLRAATAIAGRGAIRIRGSAQFDPRRACLGLLRAAAADGARIFEKSPVIRIDAARDGVCVRTRHGMVDARRVVIATGYATPHFRPLAGRFRMYRTYVLATEPMSARQRTDLGLGDVMIWDTERPYHYARWTRDHRLLLGGADRPVEAGPRRDLQFRTATRELRDYFDRLLPALSTVDTSAAWEGLFAMTADSFPYIGSHRSYPGHWFALGYGGNGITFGFLAARLLLEIWRGHPSRDIELLGFGRTRR